MVFTWNGNPRSSLVRGLSTEVASTGVKHTDSLSLSLCHMYLFLRDCLLPTKDLPSVLSISRHPVSGLA